MEERNVVWVSMKLVTYSCSVVNRTVALGIPMAYSLWNYRMGANSWSPRMLKWINLVHVYDYLSKWAQVNLRKTLPSKHRTNSDLNNTLHTLRVECLIYSVRYSTHWVVWRKDESKLSWAIFHGSAAVKGLVSIQKYDFMYCNYQWFIVWFPLYLCLFLL